MAWIAYYVLLATKFAAKSLSKAVTFTGLPALFSTDLAISYCIRPLECETTLPLGAIVFHEGSHS